MNLNKFETGENKCYETLTFTCISSCGLLFIIFKILRQPPENPSWPWGWEPQIEKYLVSYQTHTYTYTHSLIRSPTFSIIATLTHPLIHPLTQSLPKSPTHTLTHPLAQPLTRSSTLSHSPTHSLTRIRSPTHSSVYRRKRTRICFM